MRREVLNLSSRGCFLENTQPPRNSGCLSRSANLSGEKGRAGAALRGASNSVSEKFSKRKRQRKDGVSSPQRCGVNLLGCLLRSHLTASSPAGCFERVKSGLGWLCAHGIRREQALFFRRKCKRFKVYFALYRPVSRLQRPFSGLNTAAWRGRTSSLLLGRWRLQQPDWKLKTQFN